MREFSFAEYTHVRIGIGDFFDINEECDGRTDEDTIGRFPKDREECSCEGDKKGGFFESVELFEEGDIDESNGDIHENRCDNREWKVFEKSVEKQGGDQECEERGKESRSLVCRSTLDIERRPDKYRRHRESSQDSRSDIGESESEDFFVFAEFYLGHFLRDASRDNCLEDSDNGYDERGFKYRFDNIDRIFDTIDSEILEREAKKRK